MPLLCYIYMYYVCACHGEVTWCRWYGHSSPYLKSICWPFWILMLAIMDLYFWWYDRSLIWAALAHVFVWSMRPKGYYDRENDD
jgi:hypothetical protein